MRKSRFTEEQIINILKVVETGQRVTDACRTHGISEQTYHRWKAKYGGLDVNEAAVSSNSKMRTDASRQRSPTSRSRPPCACRPARPLTPWRAGRP